MLPLNVNVPLFWPPMVTFTLPCDDPTFVTVMVLPLSVPSIFTAFFVLGGVHFLLFVARTITEEAKLIERFGDDYRQYMQNTGRFIPRIGGR